MKLPTKGGLQELTLINESDLYLQFEIQKQTITKKITKEQGHRENSSIHPKNWILLSRAKERTFYRGNDFASYPEHAIQNSRSIQATGRAKAKKQNLQKRL